MTPPSRPVRVGLIQWRATPGAPEENLEAAVSLITRAGEAGCELVVLPELWPCGYDPATLAADVAAGAEPLDGPRGRRLGELAARHEMWLCAGSVPELDAGRRYNTAPLYDPHGRLVARHRKFHLYAPGGEPQAFDGGDGPTALVSGEHLGTIGLTVCFDGDFPETARALREAGARLVLEPAAYEFAAETWWERLYPGHALANGQWWLLANQAGGPADSGCFGSSRIISPAGEIIAQAPRVAPDTSPEPHVLVADVDFAAGWATADAESAFLFEDRETGGPVSVLDDRNAGPLAAAR